MQGDEAKDKGAPAGKPAVRKVMLRDLQRRDFYVHSRDSRPFNAGCRQDNNMWTSKQIPVSSANSR